MKKLISLMIAAICVSAWADDNVAEVVAPDGSVRSQWTVLAWALNDAQPGDTVRMLKNVTLTAQDNVMLWLGKDGMTLDLNGFTLEQQAKLNGLYVNADGTTVKNGTIVVAEQSCIALWGAYSITVTNSMFSGATSDTSCFSVYCPNGSHAVFKAGTVMDTEKVMVSEGGTLVIENATTTANVTEWGSDSGLSIIEGIFHLSPWGRLEAGSIYCHCDLGYVVAPEDEIDKYDLAPYVARVGQNFYSNFTEAYWAVMDTPGGTITFCKDVEFDGLASSSQTITLDLHGHTIRGKGWNFVSVWDGKKVTVRGGGTIVDDFGGACLYAGAENCMFDVRDCTVSGKLAAYGEANTAINFLSDDLVVDTESFVCGSGELTVNVSNGVIRSAALWDSGDGESGTMVNAAGGSWALDPVAMSAKPKFAIADGKVVRRDTPNGLYKVVDWAEQKVSADLAGDAPATVYTGTAPEGRMTLKVALSASGAWDGEKKAIADFSGLSGFDPSKVDLVIESCPEAYAGRLDVKFRSGVLSAGIRKGLVLLFR